MSIYNNRKTTVTDLDTGEVHEFNTISEAMRFTGCRYYQLLDCADNGYRFKHFIFHTSKERYIDDGMHVIAIENDGTMKEYRSIRAFAESHYTNTSTARDFIKKKHKTSILDDLVKDAWFKGEKH